MKIIKFFIAVLLLPVCGALTLSALERDHRKRHGTGIDRLVYALYLPSLKLWRASGLTPRRNQAGGGLLR